MALFGFGKDKKDAGGTEQVLAYLEELQRTRTPVALAGPRKNEASATVQSVDEDAGQVRFQGSAPAGCDKGSRLQVTFVLDGLRLGCTCAMVEARSGQVVAELPEGLEVLERRAHPRARLLPKEGTTITALTSLFEGVGITGAVENLSEGGARVRVEKAIAIKGEKRLPLGVALVPPGQAFMVVRINKAPKCPPVMELSGRAVFLESVPGGLVMGLAFDSLPSEVAGPLRNLVNSRATAIPSSPPPKARRKPEPAREPDPAPAPPAAAKATPAKAPAASSAEPPAAERTVPVAPDPEPEPDPEPSSAPARTDPLLRLRKRSRAVVALAPSEAHRAALHNHLAGQGYGRPLVAADLPDFLAFLEQPNLGAIFLDGDMGDLEALQLVADLKERVPGLPPVILALEHTSASMVLAAHRAGVSQIVVKPYDLDGAFTDVLDQLMAL